MSREERQKTSLCRRQARGPASLGLGESPRAPVELRGVLCDHTQPRSDAKDVGDPSQEGARSIGIRKSEPDVHELEQGERGDPRHRGSCELQQLLGPFEPPGCFA